MKNTDKYAKCVQKSEQFHSMFNELCEKGNIIVEYGENFANFEAFIAYCKFFSVVPSGGAITRDNKGQVLYID